LIKDIVVQLTGSDEDDVRLLFAREIATAHNAHLIGVHLHLLPDLLEVGEPTRSSYVQGLLEESEAAANAAFVKLEATFSQLECLHELRRLHGLASGIGGELATIARTADLFIGTRPYGDIAQHHKIEEAVLFGSGRGSLFLPPGGRPTRTFQTILVAWDGSRAAARAMAEAMPFLKAGDRVILGNVADPLLSEKENAAVFSNILPHLERHEISASPIQLPYRSGTGEQLEALAHQQGADLIVAGAYGHSKLIEWALGGVTRGLLRYSTLPLLMAH
jgi:nucleotide-binding universal stress UspA family protein